MRMHAVVRFVATVSRETIILPVRLYRRVLSPLIPNRCRYVPSCSSYAIEAVRRRGIVGLGLAAWRILRCNPWSHGGFDPVPARGWRPVASDEAELRARFGRPASVDDTSSDDTH